MTIRNLLSKTTQLGMVIECELNIREHRNGRD